MLMTKTELGLAVVLAATLIGPARGVAQTGTTTGQKPPQPTASQPTGSQPTKPGTTPGSTPGSSTGTQTPGTNKPAPSAPSAQTRLLPQTVTPPADYVIGPDDILQVVYWREKDLSAEVVVRPDGKISLPLVNDIQAAGFTPDQLRENVMKAASRYVTDPSVTIAVKQINSRRVFVTGNVNKPGPYPINDSLTVLQMLSMAGGTTEFANEKEILIMRVERGQTQSFKFNYKEVRKGRSLQQNIVLKPGDTIVVP